MESGLVVKIAAVLYWLAVISIYRGNPFLDAADDKAASADFRGTERGDDIDQNEILLAAQVVTTRIVKMQWGSIFKIEFTKLKSGAKKHREIQPEYFMVTDDRIVLLHEKDNDAAAKKISAFNQPPGFERANIYRITNGRLEYEEGPWKTAIRLKGDLCITTPAILLVTSKR